MKLVAKSLLVLGLMSLGALVVPTTAHATLQLTLSVTRTNGGSPVTQSETISTNSGGTIFAGGGVVIPMGSSFSLPFDGFNVTGLFATSMPDNRSLQDSPFMVVNNGPGTGTLSLMLSDDGMTTPMRNGLNLSSGASLNTNSGTVTFQSFVGQGLNDTSGIHSTVLTFGPTNATVSQNSPVISNFGVAGSPFSLTSIATFTLAQGGSTTGFSGTSMVSTPEPATLVATLSGVPVVGLFFWRRRRRVAVGTPN